VNAAKRQQVKQLVVHRWNQLHSPIHAAGYILDPEFCDHDQNKVEEVMNGFLTMGLRQKARGTTFVYTQGAG
jgi:hypothetical protein